MAFQIWCVASYSKLGGIWVCATEEGAALNYIMQLLFKLMCVVCIWVCVGVGWVGDHGLGEPVSSWSSLGCRQN
jgi:hypothetical protein